MIDWWQGVSERERDAALKMSLAELVASPLIEVENAVVFQDLLTPSIRPTLPEDATGYEATINKIYVRDYVESDVPNELLVQGVQFAEMLSDRLEKLGRPCTIILSLDSDSQDVSIRFFMKREAQPWGVEDLEKYTLEAVMQWDVG